MSATRSNSVRVLAWTFAGIVVVGAFGVGVAYALGCFDPNPKIAAQQELTTKLTAAVGEKSDNRQRLSLMKDVGEKIRPLPEDLRRPLGEQMQRMMTQHINRVMAMAPAEQAAAMDKDIELIQLMSQEVEKQRAEKGAQQGDKAAGRGDPNQSNAGRNRMLSSIPADQRANWSNNRQLFQAYQVMLQNRATQRGIAFPAIGQR